MCDGDDCSVDEGLWLVTGGTPAGDVRDLDVADSEHLCNDCLDDVIDELPPARETGGGHVATLDRVHAGEWP